jgi:predicted Holliday junction resolvase-like endonuclease
VIDTSKFGRGFPDLLVISRTNQIVLLEVKSPGGRLTKAEKAFHDATEGADVYIVDSLDEAISTMVYVENRRC